MLKSKLRKRIALVAVGTLTAGLMSVVAAPSANAALGARTQNGGSTGIVSGLAAGSAVTMTADGIFSIDIATGTSAVGVSGGKITGITSQTGGTAVIVADGSSVSQVAGTMVGLQFKPTAAGTNMVIKLYASTEANPTYGGYVATSPAVTQTITATVVAAGASGTFNAGKSYFSIQAIGSDVSTVSDALYEDRARGGNEIRVNYDLVDALGTAGTGNMAATTSVIAQITSGACVVGSTAGSNTCNSCRVGQQRRLLRCSCRFSSSNQLYFGYIS